MIYWDPEFGQLAIREIRNDIENSIIDVELFFLKNKINYAAPTSIAIYKILDHFNNDSNLIYCTNYMDYVRSTEYKITKYSSIKRHLASDEDLHFLLKAWNRFDSIWPDEWIYNIRKYYVEESEILNKKEFDRLNSITSEYIRIGNPLNKFRG